MSFGTCTSAVTVVSVRLVGVLTTFRVPDKDREGDWSLGCTETFPPFLPIARLSRKVFLSYFFPFLFFLIISVITLTPDPMLHLNVCSLGWVIDSNDPVVKSIYRCNVFLWNKEGILLLMLSNTILGIVSRTSPRPRLN